MEEEWEAYKYGTAAANILMTSHIQNLKSVLDAGAYFSVHFSENTTYIQHIQSTVKAGAKRSGKYFINDNAFLFGNNSLRRGEEFKAAGRKQLARAKPDRGSPLRWRSTALLRETKATNADDV